MAFVINLSSATINCPRNDYGYWTGKTYRVQYEEYPSCELFVTPDTKRYTSKKRAESIARKLLDRCQYVMTLTVENTE